MRAIHFVVWWTAISVLALSDLSSQERCCRPPDARLLYLPAYSQKELSNGKLKGEDEARVIRIAKDALYVETPNFFHRGKGYWVTRNDGLVWNRVGKTSSNLGLLWSDLIVSLFDDRVVYKRSERPPCVYLRSRDGGKTWDLPRYFLEGVSPEEFSLRLTSIENYRTCFLMSAIDPKDPLDLYATITLVFPSDSPSENRMHPDYPVPGLFVSHDGGDTWTKLSDALRPGSPIGISPSNPKLMYGHAGEGVVKSTNGGADWTPVNQHEALELPIRFVLETEDERQKRESVRMLTLEIRQFAIASSDPRVVFIVSNKGIFRTTDGGQNWCLLNLGQDEVDLVNSIAIDPTNADKVFAGTRYGVFISRDKGCHFGKVFPPRSWSAR